MSVLHVQKIAGISGSEAHLLQLLPDLRSRGWRVSFLMLHEGEPGAAEFARLLEARGVPVDTIEMTADLDPRAFARVVAYLARTRPTILHTHLVHAEAYGLTAGSLIGVPIRLATKHGFNEFRSGRVFALADRALGRFAHRQIAISRGLARYLSASEGFSERDFEIVHYGIAAAPAPPAPLELEPRFLCIGRLISIKGHETLLRAFRVVLDRHPDARLEIAGQGALGAELAALARALGLDEAVSFLGRVSPVQPVIERAFAVVVPSIGEGFGMVALEAMERGRAVVASRVGGLGDLVRDGRTGLLVPPADSASLAEAMLALLADPARAAAMGAAGRVRALSRFGEDRCAERTECIYRDWLDRRGIAHPGAPSNTLRSVQAKVTR